MVFLCTPPHTRNAVFRRWPEMLSQSFNRVYASRNPPNASLPRNTPRDIVARCAPAGWNPRGLLQRDTMAPVAWKPSWCRVSVVRGRNRCGESRPVGRLESNLSIPSCPVVRHRRGQTVMSTIRPVSFSIRIILTRPSGMVSCLTMFLPSYSAISRWIGAALPCRQSTSTGAQARSLADR